MKFSLIHDLLQPVSQRAGTNSLSMSTGTLALYLGSGSVGGFPAVASFSSEGGWSSPTPWALVSPTEGGP